MIKRIKITLCCALLMSSCFAQKKPDTIDLSFINTYSLSDLKSLATGKVTIYPMNTSFGEVDSVYSFVVLNKKNLKQGADIKFEKIEFDWVDFYLKQDTIIGYKARIDIIDNKIPAQNSKLLDLLKSKFKGLEMEIEPGKTDIDLINESNRKFLKNANYAEWESKDFVISYSNSLDYGVKKSGNITYNTIVFLNKKYISTLSAKYQNHIFEGIGNRRKISTLKFKKASGVSKKDKEFYEKMIKK